MGQESTSHSESANFMQIIPHRTHVSPNPKHDHKLNYCDGCDVVFCDICLREWQSTGDKEVNISDILPRLLKKDDGNNIQKA